MLCVYGVCVTFAGREVMYVFLQIPSNWIESFRILSVECAWREFNLHFYEAEEKKNR